ncbi:MAG: hypothetical protein H6657_25085 [Ardenticatenaceae bacterium]|nr:hypothetical protein [Ardenticatenaceae bacterium]
MTDSATYLSQLHQLLNQHFNLAEIRILCLDLNIDYESVAGEEKPSRIRELLLGLGRNGRLPDLITLAQQLRPNVNWLPIPDDFELSESLADDKTAVSPNQYHIYGDNVQGDKVTGDKVGRDKNVVGDISGQALVAVGERAQATIHQYGDIIIRADNFEDLPPAPGEPPYKGLAYFSTKDKHIFFGREKLSDQLADRLQTARFLAIIGASGSGKSSLLRAGIIPRLEERNWRIHIIKPGICPLAALSASLTQDKREPAAADVIGKALATNPNTLHKTAEKLVARTHAERLLLAVDQFEELFTQCRDPQEQQAFVDNIVSAAQTQGAVTVLLSIRADFYGHVSQFSNLTDLISQQQVYIKPMVEEDLVRVIAEPAKRSGWQFVEGLVEQFVADVGNEPGRLPLLSHALLETWERRHGVVMTLGGYREAGRVKSAIAKSAEATYAALTAPEQAIAKRIFLRLTELGNGTEDTRRRVHQVELGEDTAVQAVTQQLTTARLITATEDGIDVAHEALIREWPRLRKWLDADREGLIIHRRLTDAEREWRNNEQDSSLLYSGFRLNEAEQWVKNNPDLLNDLEQSFLRACITERQRLEREIDAQRRRTIIVLATAFSIAFVFAVAAYFSFLNSEASAETANKNLATATAALISAETANTEAIFQRNAALEASTAEAHALATSRAESTRAFHSESDAIANADLANRESTRAFENEGTAVANANIALTEVAIRSTAEASALIAQQEAEEQLLYSQARELSAEANNKLIFDPELSGLLALYASWLTYEHNGEITQQAERALYEVAHVLPDQQVLSGHTDEIHGVAFSLDGTKLATASFDGSIKIWELPTNRLLMTLVGHTERVGSVAFSPQGDRIASAGYDYTIRVWDIDTGKETLRLPTTSTYSFSAITRITFSHDGNRIAATGRNMPPKVWNSYSGELLLDISSNSRDIAFSPDNSQLAISGFMLDAASGEILFDFNGASVAFSPDGFLLATGNSTGYINIFNANTGEEVGNIHGHIDDIVKLAFTHNGQYLATASWDGTVKLWDIASKQLITIYHNGDNEITDPISAHGSDQINDIAIHPDDNQIAIGANRIQLWNFSAEPLIPVYSGHDERIQKIVISPEGDRFYTLGTSSGLLYAWDMASGDVLYTLAGGRNFSLSPDGTLLAISYINETCEIREAFSGEKLTEFSIAYKDPTEVLTVRNESETDEYPYKPILSKPQLGGAPREIFFSSDSTKIISLAGGQVATVFDINSGDAILTFPKNSGTLLKAAYSLDGSRLVTAQNNTFSVWDPALGKELLSMPLSENLSPVIMSPRGSLILMKGEENYVEVWDTETGQKISSITANVDYYYTGANYAAFSYDDALLIIKDLNGETKIWDVATGEELHTLLSYSGSYEGISFSPSGKRMISIHSDGQIRMHVVKLEELFTLVEGRLTRQLTDQECSDYLHAENCEIPTFSTLSDHDG